ncbi:MAG: DUF982 domain-containing protein [Mesorhizobium sp.]|nr:DUF982 domain-containing protein [Mesorhizobium sp.]MBN9243911.1 DUF982 domain-containing protein [Mesorhizobium sp.]
MKHAQFDQPVSVFIGLGFPREIETVLDAYDVLIEWSGLSDLDRSAAIDVCRKALNGEKSGKDAREAFQRFADGKGILVDDAYRRASTQLAREWSILPAV